MNFLPPTPEMNPTLALARSIMSPTDRYEESRILVEMGTREQQQKNEELIAQQAEEDIIKNIADAARAMRRGTQLELLKRLRGQIQAERAQSFGEDAMQAPVEGDILAAMGLMTDSAGEEDLGAENGSGSSTKSSAFAAYLTSAPPQDVSPFSRYLMRPSTKQSSARTPRRSPRGFRAVVHDLPPIPEILVKMSMDMGPDTGFGLDDERHLQNASLVGFTQPEGEVLEAYIEEMDPSHQDRARRAGMLGATAAGVGGLAGIGLNTLTRRGGLDRFLKKRPDALTSRKMPAALALLGAGIGGAWGALSNRPITTTYNTATGATLSRTEAAAAQRIFDKLQPGAQPGNFAISAPGADLGGPRSAYAFDLDEAISEDPELASTLL